MLDEARTLVCFVNGEERRFPAAVVQRVSLRLPITGGSGAEVLTLDGISWPVHHERSGEPAMSDHFVFIEDERGRRVIVVDRVAGVEPGSTGNAGDR